MSVDGFFEYIDKSNNPNIKLLQAAVFSHMLGYFILKAGICQCNYSYFHCGKQLVMPIFFANIHPQYRKLNLYFDFDMALMPGYMYNQIKRTIGLKEEDKGSLDDESNGEHFDFIVECVNKRLKSNLSWAPSHLLWLSACRTFDFALSLSKNMNRWFKFIRLYIIFYWKILLGYLRLLFHAGETRFPIFAWKV